MEAAARVTSSSKFRIYVDSTMKGQKKLRGKFVNISSILKVESTLTYSCRIDFPVSTWIHLLLKIHKLLMWNFDVKLITIRQRYAYWA